MLPQSLLSNYTFSHMQANFSSINLNRICIIKLRQQKLVHPTAGSFKDPQAGAKLFGSYWEISTILPPKQTESTRLISAWWKNQRGE